MQHKSMQSFTELDAWKIGLEFVKEIYVLTKQFPKDELYGLTSQLRRSTVSVLANLAEGHGRFTYADKANKYTISRGECAESHALLLIAISLNYLTKDEATPTLLLNQRLGKMVSGLINAAKSHR
jgi:four helix bundle protein